MQTATNVLDSISHSKEIIEAATAQAEAIKESARREAEQIKETARAEGLEEGRAYATKSLLTATELRRKTLEAVREDVIEVALIFARDIVAQEIKTNPESIASRLSRALRECIGAKLVRLVVNPEDAPYVNKNLDVLRKQLPPVTNLSVVEDQAISTGSAVIETDISIIEANLETHLKALQDHFLIRKTAEG